MKFWSLVLFLWIGNHPLFSQWLNFININIDMGLPSNKHYRVVQDKNGYIWISTEAGLARYNAKEFVVFDKSKGMPSTNGVSKG